jgi:hypothetical protein
MSNGDELNSVELDALTYLSGQFPHLGAKEMVDVLRLMNGNVNRTIVELSRIDHLKKAKSEESENKETSTLMLVSKPVEPTPRENGDLKISTQKTQSSNQTEDVMDAAEKERKLEELKKIFDAQEADLRKLVETKEAETAALQKSQTVYNQLMAHNQSVLASNVNHDLVSSLRDHIAHEIFSKSSSLANINAFSKTIKRNLALKLLEEAEEITITDSNKDENSQHFNVDNEDLSKPKLFSLNAYAESDSGHAMLKSTQRDLNFPHYPAQEDSDDEHEKFQGYLQRYHPHQQQHPGPYGFLPYMPPYQHQYHQYPTPYMPPFYGAPMHPYHHPFSPPPHFNGSRSHHSPYPSSPYQEHRSPFSKSKIEVPPPKSPQESPLRQAKSQPPSEPQTPTQPQLEPTTPSQPTDAYNFLSAYQQPYQQQQQYQQPQQPQQYQQPQEQPQPQQPQQPQPQPQQPQSYQSHDPQSYSQSPYSQTQPQPQQPQQQAYYNPQQYQNNPYKY